MNDIYIKVIPHNKQRYPTAGDYWLDKKGIQIRISDLGNNDYEWLILFHELVELYLAQKRKISWRKIDSFDIKFEKTNKQKEKEPGDDPKAPYYKEHQFASGIERLIAAEAGIDWEEYNKSFDLL